MPLCGNFAADCSLLHCLQVEGKFQEAVSRGADVLLTSGAQLAFVPNIKADISPSSRSACCCHCRVLACAAWGGPQENMAVVLQGAYRWATRTS